MWRHNVAVTIRRQGSHVRYAAAGCCRFDIVLLLLDQHEPTWDKIVSDHVLTTHQQVSHE